MPPAWNRQPGTPPGPPVPKQGCGRRGGLLSRALRGCLVRHAALSALPLDGCESISFPSALPSVRVSLILAKHGFIKSLHSTCLTSLNITSIHSSIHPSTKVAPVAGAAGTTEAQCSSLVRQQRPHVGLSLPPLLPGDPFWGWAVARTESMGGRVCLPGESEGGCWAPSRGWPWLPPQSHTCLGASLGDGWAWFGFPGASTFVLVILTSRTQAERRSSRGEGAALGLGPQLPAPASPPRPVPSTGPARRRVGALQMSSLGAATAEGPGARQAGLKARAFASLPSLVCKTRAQTGGSPSWRHWNEIPTADA